MHRGKEVVGKTGRENPGPLGAFWHSAYSQYCTALRMRAHTPRARSLFHLHSRPARGLCVSVGRQGRAPNTGLGG